MSGAQQMFPHPKSTVLCYWLHNRLRLFGSVLMANTNFLLHVSPKHFFSLDILLYLQLNGNRHATWHTIQFIGKINTKESQKKGNRLSSQHLELRLDFSMKEFQGCSQWQCSPAATGAEYSEYFGHERTDVHFLPEPIRRQRIGREEIKIKNEQYSEL